MSASRVLSESRITARLALPLIFGQLGQMLIGLADTLMLGRLDEVTPLAACSFATTLVHLPMMFGIGMAMAVSIRVSQARGAGDPAAARAALRHGLYIALVIGVLTVAAAIAVRPFLWIFRQDAEVVAIVPDFLLILALSMVPAMASMVVKNHADAMNRPWPVFWITMGGVALNVVLNWMLIFGALGAPRLGFEGAAVATLIARTAILVGMLVWCRRCAEIRDWIPRRWLRAPDMGAVRDLLRTGFPASMHLLAEVSAFVMATFIIGSMGKVALASHQIAIQCAATIFMIPLGLSMALTVRMGEAFGANRRETMRPILVSGWAMGVGISALSAAGFAVFNHELAALFIKEAEVLRMAAALLIVAAAFQFSDALQIIAAGALRGLNDVQVPAWIAFGAYWVVSIPLGWALALPAGYGVTGMWWGITAGLSITAVLLGRRVWRRTAAVGVGSSA